MVVDADRGLIVVNRNTVSYSLGDITIIFTGSVEVTGKVWLYISLIINIRNLSSFFFLGCFYTSYT